MVKGFHTISLDGMERDVHESTGKSSTSMICDRELGIPGDPEYGANGDAGRVDEREACSRNFGAIGINQTDRN